MNAKIILFSTLCLIGSMAFGQQNQEPAKPKYSKYYYQKASLFELLPIHANDIVFLGNSITDGGEWAEIFNMPNIKNRGIGADVTSGVYERLAPIVQGKPQKIFLLIGINDIHRGCSADSVSNAIIQIVEKIRKESPKTKVYVQSIFPEDFNIDRFKKNRTTILSVNDSLKNYCAKNKLTYIDIHSQLLAPDGVNIHPEVSNDGLHLMGSGYMIWKEAILPFVKDKK